MDVQMHLAWASVVHSCIKFLQFLFLKKSYKEKLVVTKRNLFFPLFMKLGKLMTILKFNYQNTAVAKGTMVLMASQISTCSKFKTQYAVEQVEV